MPQTRPEVRCKFYSLEEYHKRRFPQDRNARIRRLPLIALGLALAVGLAWRLV